MPPEWVELFWAVGHNPRVNGDYSYGLYIKGAWVLKP